MVVIDIDHVIVLLLVCVCMVESGSFDLLTDWTSLTFAFDNSQYTTSEAYWRQQGYPNTSALAGIKVGYNDVIYVTVPRWKSGVPSTLNTVRFETDGSATLVPFPSWEFNNNTLRNCQSMTIDTQNRMWIIEVGRENFYDPTNATLINAPAKVLVLNLNTNILEWTYQFPDSVVPYNNSFLNDIALDLQGGYAYFTNTWGDGGIIVYDFNNNASWSFSGVSTQREYNWDFIVNGYNYGYNGVGASPSDGIALSDDNAHLYYCPVQGIMLWKIPTSVLQNQSTTQADFENSAVHIGNKTGPSDGLLIQSNNLIYGDQQNSALMQVNLESSPFTGSSITLGINEVDFRWMDTFSDALNGIGTFYFVSNHLDLFFNGTMSFAPDAAPNFRIYRYTVTSNDNDSSPVVLYVMIGVVVGVLVVLMLHRIYGVFYPGSSNIAKDMDIKIKMRDSVVLHG